MNDNIQVVLCILRNFVVKYTKEYLEPKEEAIISGALEGLTYREMQQIKSILKGYCVEYISQYLAFELWQKLRYTWQRSEFSHYDIEIKKGTLWHMVEIIDRKESIPQNRDVNPFPPEMMEGKILQDQFEIKEYLFDRNSIERHYLGFNHDCVNNYYSIIQIYRPSDKIINKLDQQARILSNFKEYPQIPELLAYFQEDIYYYLIYEHIKGNPITNSLGQPWTETKVKQFLQNILSVLEFIHQHNIVHRNLNPDNLIEQPDGQIIVIDFATVKEIDRDQDGYISTTNFSEGMNGYISSEQIQGIVDPRSDIYSIGKIAIHALTGIHPINLRINRQTGNIVWRNKAQVSSELGNIIDKMVHPYSPHRYQSAIEVLEDLNKN